MIHALWIVPLILLIAFLSSPRFRGDIAETRVRRLLAAGLEKSRYTTFHDITLPASGGTVHIDHLVISRFGIFVIESQYAPGWVSGAEFQERWKLYSWRHWIRIDNPLHRNTLQVEAVEKILKVPSRIMFPMVVLVGQKGFKTVMPERVVTPENLLAYLRKKSRTLLEGEQADQAIKTIDAAQIRTLGSTTINSRRLLLQLVLFVVVLVGAWLAFHDQLAELLNFL